MGQICRNRRRAAKWVGEMGSLQPVMEFASGHLEAEHEFVAGTMRRSGCGAVKARARPRVNGRRDNVLIQKEVHRGMARAHTLTRSSRSHRAPARSAPGGASAGH